MLKRLAHERYRLGQLRVLLSVPLTHHRADSSGAAVELDRVQSRDAAQVDE